jgi:hypothetical protein
MNIFTFLKLLFTWRLGVIGFGFALGLFGYTAQRHHRLATALYPQATGPEALRVNARITAMTRPHSSRTHDGGVLTLEFPGPVGAPRSVDCGVTEDLYTAQKIGSTMAISYHPSAPDFIVTPDHAQAPGPGADRMGRLCMIIGAAIMAIILAWTLWAAQRA